MSDKTDNIKTHLPKMIEEVSALVNTWRDRGATFDTAQLALETASEAMRLVMTLADATGIAPRADGPACDDPNCPLHGREAHRRRN